MLKPILFNTEMVRAILDGKKSVTRRVVKKDISNQFDIDVDGKAISYESTEIGMHYNPIYLAPYYKGDILYVRETWGNYSYDQPNSNATYYEYRADYPDGAKTYEWPEPDEFGDKIICDLPKWHPSIHMPKEAARIFLKVTDVRVERLWDITEEQSEKEGTEPVKDALNNIYSQDGDSIGYRLAFEDLWNGTIKEPDLDKYGWNANPWVWVIEFERTEKNDG